ncbi:ComEA family DNA-binding protein [Pedobacter endophyticus]|uniref:Helix-hairpin-helix domain-containing protein n=1 Tax=Pedobacter endophyticus TaxID=2789740 RepID=A0A7S9PYZ1_9SPHI|nr:helix-hairpin-helix domain-containing protein [Pedobacter endophyticus]QPH39171.1 helix-hairpin-helix domain-containing protein [Pedobacter endophyticus]
MRIFLNTHFGFSKGQFNGLILLIFIIACLKLFPVVYGIYRPLEEDDLQLISQINKIEISSEHNATYTRKRTTDSRFIKPPTLFTFDPNTLSAGGWSSLGLSPKQAQAIVNYTAKGGRFYKREDLQKMYTISPEMYKKLLPYVKIEANEKNNKQESLYAKKEFVKKAPVIVDINTADSAQLDEIKGIGGAFANRILRYRQKLGGFYRKEQLMEVYGLDSAKYNEIKGQISMSSVALKTININTAQFSDLKPNPYLTYKQMNAIIQYRKQHGSYKGPADLKKVAILTQQVIDQITPYISF